jgi:4-hydroxythreonine-4-phosphate dehydrogenase
MSSGLTKPIAVTMGDPCGIGPEICVKLAASRDPLARPLLIIGDAGVIEHAARAWAPMIEVRMISDPNDAAPAGNVIMVLAGCEALPTDMPMGQIDRRAGQAAYDCLVTAIDHALTGKVAGIVTAPLNKEALALAGVRQPGHTEILAERTGVPDVAMMLANDDLRVVLVSIHVSLRDAIAKATGAAQLRAIKLAHDGCVALGINRPRIAVAGLNPHAGEDGLFGTEDRDIIAPSVVQARAEGFDIVGPLPGDTVFMRARRGAFDVVVAQYHDQGLIPVKLLGIDQGVNITVGLPFVRTSVDHGTAFDIAGTGQADPSSLVYAVATAERMIATAERRSAATA